MSDRIELTAAPVSLRMSRGETAESGITLRNRGKTVDQFTISIEGLDPKWYKLPVSSVALFPNDQDVVKVIISLPEAIDPGVDNYPIVVRAISQENPAEMETTRLNIEVGKMAKLGLSISPDSLSGSKGTYKLAVENPGHKECQVQLKASRPKGRMKFQLQPESLNVPANGTVEAALTVKLNWIARILGGKNYDFMVTAEQVNGTAGSEPVTQNGQLVHIPWYSWFSRIRIPWLSRPPAIKSFHAITDNKREYQIKWQVQRSNRVKLDDSDVEQQGETVVNPTEPKKYTLTAINRYGTSTKTVEVKPLPIPQARASDKIKVTINPTKYQAQAGMMPAQVIAQVQNLSTIVDKFIVEVEGLDDTWYSRSASSIALMPQATEQVQISLLPPIKKGVKEGTYTFAITVRSQTNPQEVASVIGQLEILPNVDYKIRVHPFRFAGMRKGNCSLNIANTGVSQANINIEALDLDDGCAFIIKPQSLSVGAWNTVDVPIIVKPKRSSLFGASKRFDITITTTTENGNPHTANCDFTHDPFIKSWKPVFRAIKAIVAIAIVIIAVYFVIRWGGGWDALKESPKDWFSNIVQSVEGWFN